MFVEDEVVDPWQLVPFSAAVIVNPSVRLRRGAEYPFVDMASVDPGTRWVRSVSQRKHSGGGSKFHDGDTLMARITPCLENGKIARYRASINGSAGNGSTEFIVIRGRAGVTDNDFAYYLTQSPTVRDYAINQMTGTSGRQRVPTAALDHIDVALPSLYEQRQIADILGALDDKIELNRRMNETLEQMARALFKSWFVDFDPVRAKMDGRWHLGETLPGLPAKLYDLFPDCLVPSELGETPEGWEIKRLDQMADLNPREPMVKGTVAPYLDMAALPTSGFSPNNPVIREFTSGTRFRNGDTLLARITPCLENGKTAFVQSLPQGTLGWGSTEFVVIRSAPPVPPEYTYLLARDPRFRSYVIQSMTGTSGRQRARTEALASYPLVCPSEDTWLAFGILVKPLFERVNSHSEETAILSAQQDALLPRLVSGELRLLDYAKPMELQRYDA